MPPPSRERLACEMPYAYLAMNDRAPLQADKIEDRDVRGARKSLFPQGILDANTGAMSNISLSGKKDARKPTRARVRRKVGLE